MPLPSTLSDVSVGQPHVAAHNAERHAINSIKDFLEALTILTEASVNALIAAYPHLTEADVNALIAAAPSLSEADVNALIAAYPMITADDVEVIGNELYGTKDFVQLSARREPHRRMRRHPHPPKVEITTTSTITSAVFWGCTTGGVVRPPELSVFDFGLRENQMDTVRNVYPGLGYPNSYPYNAAVLPSFTLGAPYCSYYASGFYNVRWATDEPVIEIIALIGLSQADWQIFQDGQPIFEMAQAGNPGSVNSIIRLTNPTREMRTFELVGGIFFIGVNTGPNGVVMKPFELTGPKVAWFGDSVTQGTGATVAQHGFAYTASRRLGWDRYELHAAGGTGFQAAGSFAKFIDRVPYLQDDIDVLIVGGGYNDAEADATVWAALVIEFYQAVRDVLPDAKIVHVGPWGNVRAGLGAVYTARMNALLIAFDANPGLVDHIVDTTTFGYWFTGTGYMGAPAGNGNSDFYLHTDGVHFSQAGHDYVASRITQELGRMFGRYLPSDPSVLDPRRTLVDTTANLAAASIAPAKGQLVYDETTGKLRIGDGVLLPPLLQLLNPQKWRSRVSPNGVQVAYVGAVGTPFLYYGPGSTASLGFNAIGSSLTYRGEIGPGTWTFRTWYAKLSNLGQVKIEYSLDEGATWVTLQALLEMYSAAATYQVFVDNAGVVVGAGISTVLIRWTSMSKHASSSAYYLVAGEVDLTRTA